MKHYSLPIVELVLLSGTDVLTASLIVGDQDGEILNLDYNIFF